MVAGAVAVAAAGVYLAIGLEDDALQWTLIAAGLGLAAVIGVFGWVRGRHERTVMPIIARTFGLGYEKAPRAFYAALPKNFIPLGGRRSVDDMMEGQVAGRTFRFAECKTETGGKNSSTLFQGVVLEVQGGGQMPSFLIASEKETRGFLFFKGKVQVDGMDLLQQSTGRDGQIYGLWSQTGDAARMKGLRAFLDRIIDIGPEVLGQSSLYSLVSTGAYFYVSLRHQRDMFRIGGLLANEARVMSDIRNAAAEFSHPVRLAAEVLKAEQALLAAG